MHTKLREVKHEIKRNKVAYSKKQLQETNRRKVGKINLLKVQMHVLVNCCYYFLDSQFFH